MYRSGNAPRTAFAIADPKFGAEFRRLLYRERGGFFLRKRFELIGPRPRQRADAARRHVPGKILMKSVQSDGADPIPVRTSPPRISTIMVRFVGLLFLAIVVLVLAWSS
jgi:hypothetical protein